MNSRIKGKNGELELARRLREYGYSCRRGQQYCGVNGDADIIGLPHVHVECKRTEHLHLYDAVSQASWDARPGELPAVFHRRNNCNWVVIMRLEDWMVLYNEYYSSEGEENEKQQT